MPLSLSADRYEPGSTSVFSVLCTREVLVPLAGCLISMSSFSSCSLRHLNSKTVWICRYFNTFGKSTMWEHRIRAHKYQTCYSLSVPFHCSDLLSLVRMCSSSRKASSIALEIQSWGWVRIPSVIQSIGNLAFPYFVSLLIFTALVR